MLRRETARVALAVFAILAVFAGAGAARADEPRSPHEEQRRKILQELGLKKKDTAPAAAVPNAPAETLPATAPETAPGDVAGPAAGTRDKAPAVAGGVSFRHVVHPLLMQACRPCHGAGGPAAATRLVLSGEPVGDHALVARLVSVADAAASPLLAKSSGAAPHAGGAPWPEGSAPHGHVLAWIKAGARLDGGPPTPPKVTTATTVATMTPPAHGPSARATGAAPPSSDTPAPDPLPPPYAPATEAAPAAPVLTTTAHDPSAYRRDVHPLLLQTCRPCHGAGGPAAATRLVLSGEPTADHAVVARLVFVGDAAASPLLAKSSGAAPHAGGAAWPEGSAPRARVLAWIQAGARLDDAPTTTGTLPPVATRAAPPPPAPPAPAPPSDRSGLLLPGGFALDGRFDVAYERRAFSGDPFAAGSTNGLRSYHHFLFLSRDSTADPVGISVELTSLLFWEAHARWASPNRAVRVTLSGGKLLVPFGADPLFHQMYGGHSGFDQRILPVIWAQEGVAAHVLVERRTFAVTDDVYLVRGYALHQADGVLNLQNDFSSTDDARLAVGDRVGASYGPLSFWYSALFNPLGFGRRLFMQAADVTLWRVRGVPVLEHLSFAAGLIRADVSGGDGSGVGGPGRDYYHFGSYFQVRLHPTDWLTFQYRQGVRTFDNRRGVWIDRTRLTRDDGSTHNFAIIARRGGLTATLAWFINLEKADEVPDDLARLSVAYDF
jgi:hypothetical protein